MPYRVVSLAAGIMLAWSGGALATEGNEVSFNVNEVVEEVTYHSVREGEFLIGTNIVIPAPNNQWYPSVAFDGNNYLVVWYDERRGDGYSDIYGTRVDQSGVVLDTGGIAICTAANYQWTPSVAFDGTDYLVVWMDLRSSSDYDIYGARVNQSGEVLDTAGIAISTALYGQYSPSVAFDGANFLVAWWDSRSGSDTDIYGARVDQSGEVLDSAGIAISTAAGDQEYPSVVFNGTDYLVVWEDSRSGSDTDIYGARVDQSGELLDSAGIAISTAPEDQEYPSVALNGTDYLVVWEDSRSGSDTDIYGARVDQSGETLDSAGIAISTAAEDQGYPSVAFDGTDYLVVWQDQSPFPDTDIYGARVDQSGVVLDPGALAISTAASAQYSPSVVFNGTDYLVVWEDSRSGADTDIYGARVDQSGEILDSAGIAISTVVYVSAQYSPSVVFNGIGYLVVWMDWRRGSETDIYGARVDQSGEMLDSVGIAISTAVSSQHFPSVAFDGTNYLVVWQDWRRGDGYSDIYGARMDQSGEMLDAEGIAICIAAEDQWTPSVAFDGTNYLVVWQDWHRGDGYSDIYGARVDQSGMVLDTGGIAICTTAHEQWTPSVAFDGTDCLVVWMDSRGSYWDIYGARVDQSGVVLDPVGIAISTAAYGQYDPSVAFNGTGYLVVWEDWRRGDGYSDIYGARVGQSGVVFDSAGIAICTTAEGQRNPSVAFDGADYLVVWDDFRNGSECDLYGARVDQSGVVGNSFAVSHQSGDQFSPAIAHGTDNQLLVTYSGWTESINGHPANTMRIWGKFLPPVGVEEWSVLRDTESALSSTFPNPFRLMTTITYSVLESGHVSMKIYDASGRLVRMLVDEETPAGRHTVIWNTTDDAGREVPSGSYFVRLYAGEYRETRKMVLVR